MRARSVLIMVVRKIIVMRVKFIGGEGGVRCGGEGDVEVQWW